MRPTRRELLQSALAATALAGCGSAAPARRLLLLTASGGIDTTWSYDPKPGLAGVDPGPGDVALFAGIPVCVDPARPVARRFFERFGPQCAVVNGIGVRSIAHSACSRRMLTGTSEAHAPDVAAIVGAERGAERPVPYLVLGDVAYPGALEGLTGRTGPSNQLATLADAPVDPVEAAGIRAYVAAGVARRRGAFAGSAELDAYLDALDRSDDLVARAGTLGTETLLMGRELQRDLAVQALQTDLCAAVSLSSGLSFDTHTDNDLQGSLQEDLFGELELLLDALAAAPAPGGGRLLDDTLVVVTTEMGRSPLTNAQAGKDHWPWASALLFGAGVRGGRAYGATDDGLQGLPVDFATGEAATGGQILESGNLVAGLLALCGVDPEPWLPGVAPFTAFSA
ncbi:MAG: DUF1501 domain-containing protein [Myxococcota bacterium]